MAETIVKFVMGKLGDVVVQEALVLYGVDAQVGKVSRELRWIQAFLKDADEKHISDEMQKLWVKEMRDIAYSIEDVIDTFLLEISDPVPQESSFTQCFCLQPIMEALNRMLTKAKKLLSIHKLAEEISKIHTRLEEIKACTGTYRIANLGEGTGEIKLPIRPPVLPSIDPDIVGFKEDQAYVVNALLDENVTRRSVVSIWGVGGLGKTTLAQKVYNSNDVKNQFDLRIWVDISQKFEIIGILGKIAEQLEQSKKEVSIDKLHESLRGKKYIIVLDDVWTNDLWTQIGAALPDDNNGSRVLLTTRFLNIPMYADPTCNPYKLGLLTKELSLELLIKNALPNQNPNEIDSNGLSGIVDGFIDKCEGLPIALVVLGRLLATKTLDFITWSKVLNTVRWFNDGEKILATSYKELPFALKLCFMYFAAFPENYKIDAKTLLRMWVAEGFIPEEDKRTLEETAESFLEDLVQRSMVQVIVRSIDGSIEYCRIHDLLRDLAVQKAKDDNFLVVYSHPNDQERLNTARRVAVHHLDGDELVMSKNLRTLLYFHNKRMPNCSKQRLLRVVSTGDSKNTKINLEMFEDLTQLRYLNLTGKLSGKCEKVYWEKVIGAMKFLQTFDMNDLYRGDIVHFMEFRGGLPDCAWGSKTLRHIKTPFLELPSSANLMNLQTIESVTANESWDTEIPHLPNLLTLILKFEISWEKVAAFLRRLDHLISLSLTCYDVVPLDIVDMRSFPFYPHLQSLSFNAWANRTVIRNCDVSFFPPHLTSLTISYYKFQRDIMPVLGKLLSLKKLLLEGYEFYISSTMTFLPKGFSQLEFLHLKQCGSIKFLVIEEGAMPNLRELKITMCGKLSVPQGLRHLTNLQKLSWWKSDVDYREGSEEVRNLCKHVPSVSLNW